MFPAAAHFCDVQRINLFGLTVWAVPKIPIVIIPKTGTRRVPIPCMLNTNATVRPRDPLSQLSAESVAESGYLTDSYTHNITMAYPRHIHHRKVAQQSNQHLFHANPFGFNYSKLKKSEGEVASFWVGGDAGLAHR